LVLAVLLQQPLSQIQAHLLLLVQLRQLVAAQDMALMAQQILPMVELVEVVVVVGTQAMAELVQQIKATLEVMLGHLIPTTQLAEAAVLELWVGQVPLLWQVMAALVFHQTLQEHRSPEPGAAAAELSQVVHQARVVPVAEAMLVQQAVITLGQRVL
jgi:hypothetical protein